MARARGGGATGYAVALAFFAAGFLICLLLAIIFYTQVSGARSEAEQAQSELRYVASPNELQSPEIAPLREGQGTIVGKLVQERADLNTQISSLQSQITRLQAELQGAQQARQQAEQAAAQAEERAQQARQQAQQAQQRFQQAAGQVESRVGQVEQSAQQYSQQISQAQQNMQQEIARLTEELTSAVQDRDTQIGELQTELRQMRDRLAELREQQAELAPKTDPDGRIVAVNEGDNTVYLNIGRNERVIPGMTFEIFSSGELIKLDEFDELRGKATVEVVTVNEASSLARIVRRSQRGSIGEGDVIANIAFDVNATPKFFVFGEFDIDATGAAGPGDRQRVESMINQWGGQVVEELTPDVDFLVLGEQPAAPEELPPTVTNPEVIARNVEQTQRYERYLNLVGEARTLNIPVLNQNRFLSLIGYYRR